MINNRGFTLLEIMIVIGIMGIVLMVTYPKMSTPKAEFDLQTSARQCMTDIRYAQQLSIDEMDSYGIYFTTNGYQLKKTSGEVLKNITFSSGTNYLSIQGITENNVIFNSRGIPVDSFGNSLNTAKIDLINTKNNSHINIIVTSNTGEVRLEWN